MRKLSRADIMCGAGLAVGIAFAYVMVPVAPHLLRNHGILLEALTASIVSMVSAGARARVGLDPLLLVVLAPLVAILLYDVWWWWAGRRWGERILQFYVKNNPRLGKWIRRAEKLIRRRGVIALIVEYYLPIPNNITYLVCGASGMSLWLFLIGDAIGTVLWEALIISLGWAIGHPVVAVVNRVSHDATFVTVALIVGIIVWSGFRGRQRAMAAAGQPPAADPEPQQEPSETGR